jgi:hypothetical protein
MTRFDAHLAALVKSVALPGLLKAAHAHAEHVVLPVAVSRATAAS